MIVEARQGVVTMMIICPHCKFGARHSVGYIEDAIHDNKSIMCVACAKEFGVVTVRQTRTAELQRAAVQPAIELLVRIKEKVLTDENYDADDMVSEIDAVLKTAGGG